MNTATRDENLELILARLMEFQPGHQEEPVVSLPSWGGTVGLLDDLHRLLLASIDRSEARKRLVNASAVLAAQIEACLATRPPTRSTSPAVGSGSGDPTVATECGSL